VWVLAEAGGVVARLGLLLLTPVGSFIQGDKVGILVHDSSSSFAGAVTAAPAPSVMLPEAGDVVWAGVPEFLPLSLPERLEASCSG
jgi:hypothetical protein